jgi:hypothetical protein
MPGLAVQIEGVLLHARDRRPAAGIGLAFVVGERETEVSTDARGRFALGPFEPHTVVNVRRVGQDALAGCSAHEEIQPQRVLVPEREGGALELLFFEPDAWLDVQVSSAGRPAEARVSCGSTGAGTGPDGRVRIPLCDLEVGEEVRVVARIDGAQSSPAKLVHPWPDEVLFLELRATGTIRVRVTDAAGAPASGVRVRLAYEAHEERTDRLGLASFHDLLPGEHRIAIEGRLDALQTVEVPEGGEAWLECVLPALPLLVGGRVVDEADEPLAGVDLWFRHGASWARAESRADGAFQAFHEIDPSADVLVMVGGDVEGERFERERFLVPVGARDVLVRRLARLEEVELSLALVDASTQWNLGDALVTFHRGGEESYSAFAVSDGLLQCSLEPYEDTLAVARAFGYRDRTLTWSELAAGLAAGRVHKVLLQPGMDLRVRVLDALTQAPLSGARFLDAGSLLATTDADGRARLVGDTWPASLRVTADGYESGTWTAPEVPWEPSALFELVPLE